MRAAQPPVKRSRRYDATTRQQRAAAAHDAALAIAEELFVRDGYERTTVAAIAAAAGVSEATVYKSYGGKAGLAREICRRALEGDDTVPAEERSDALRGRTTADQLAEGWGRLATEVAPRVAPLALVLRNAAQADADAAALYDDLDRARLARMTDNAKHLQRAGHLRDGVSLQEASDVLWLTSAPELYELLVIRRRWSRARYGRFVSTMIRTLTP